MTVVIEIFFRYASVIQGLLEWHYKTPNQKGDFSDEAGSLLTRQSISRKSAGISIISE